MDDALKQCLKGRPYISWRFITTQDLILALMSFSTNFSVLRDYYKPQVLAGT